MDLDFNFATKTFIDSYFANRQLNGSEKFLILSALESKGDSVKMSLQQIIKIWPKTIMKISYNPYQYSKAISNGWIEKVERGHFNVTTTGYEYLKSISSINDLSSTSSDTNTLLIFETSKTYSFDEFIRSKFKRAKTKVWILDPYIDKNIFSNLLDNIPNNLPIRIIGNNFYDGFARTAKRFKNEFLLFSVRKTQNIHDRFIIIDDRCFIIGTSLKDAAQKSFTTVVSLNCKDSLLLNKIFNKLWGNSKKIL